MKILNELVHLKKVELLPENGLLLKFDNLPIWRNNTFNIYFTVRHHDYYEGIYIYFKENILNYHMLFQKQVGEQLYLEIYDQFLNVWYAEDFDHVEERNTLDYLEEIEILNFDFKKLPKTSEDWKNEYMELEKTYLELKIKNQ